MAKKKILYIITQGHWGGAQKYVYDLLTNLGDEYEVTVAVGNSSNGLRTTDYGLRTDLMELKNLQRSINPIKDILAIFEIRKLYNSLKPEIVHLNSSKAGILGSFASWIMDHGSLSIIYTAHGWVFDEPLEPFKKWLYRFLEKITARAKNYTIVLSNKDKKTAENVLRIPSNKLKIIPNGIGPNKETLTLIDARLELKISNDDFVIGSIANHYKTKGLDILIDSFAKVCQQIDNARLVIIGDGPETNNLKMQIANCKLEDKIILSGYQDNASKYLPAFDLFVLASRKEGLPYTLLEAMIANVPVIATKVGGIPEVIEDKITGLLVSPENSHELSKAIIYAYQNPDEIKKMAQKGHLTIEEKFSIDKMVESTRNLYKKMTNDQ
jgi:glycosyltransferase involved in cell wall biosynthesis